MLSDNQVQTLASAATPEEAAQKFKKYVTLALAEAVRDALESSLVKASAAAGAKSGGWTDLIRGASLTMCWDRADELSALPMSYASTFAPRNQAAKLLGGEFSIGISIGGRF